MSLLSLFITAFWVSLSGAMMPGPLMTVTVNESLHRGFIVGPLVVLGHAIVEILLLLGMAWGLNEFVGIPWVKAFIGFVGGLFLLWMGFGILKDVPKIKIEFSGESEFGSKKGLVLKGILVSLSNPYFILWWATLGLTYLTMALDKGILGLGVFFFAHILADFICNAGLAYLIGEGRRFFNITVYRGILAVCGLFLAFLGCYFIYSGVIFLA